MGSWKSHIGAAAAGAGRAATPKPTRTGGAGSLSHSVPKRTGTCAPAFVALKRPTTARPAEPLTPKAS